MAITVTEVMGSRKAGWSYDDGRSYSLKVRVLTGNRTVGPRAALLAVGVGAGAYYQEPLFGAPTEVDYACFLSTIDADEEGDDGLSYLVSLTYRQIDWRTLFGGSGSGADPITYTANPINAPPSLKWSTETEELARPYDRNGEPILNKAGDPFDPVLTSPATTPIVTITRRLANFDPGWIIQYKDHVNDADWMGFDLGTVLCKDMTADRVHDTDWGWMWEQTIVLAIRPIISVDSTNPDTPWVTNTAIIQDGWSLQVLNAGLRQLVGGVVKQISIDGQPITTPVPLQHDGSYDPTGTPVYLTFDLYEQADFTQFNFPLDLFSVQSDTSPAGSA